MTSSASDLPSDKGRILLVDDDPVILEMLRLSVTDLGFETDTAVDGRDAIEKLDRGKFDLVLSDMTMPERDGMQLLKHIKNESPRLPVIVITGYTDDYTYTEVIRAGASDFITKPFNIDELEAKINRVFREQHLVEKLEQLSMCDALTGLFNRRGFETRLEQEAIRSYRQGYPLFMIFLDIDRFKRYNDTHGHPAGDNVLQGLARILNRCIRKDVDSSYRFGGDEFAVIIPHADTDQVGQIAERIREVYFREIGADLTTLSLGVSRFSRRDDHPISEDIAAFVAAADRALYAGKAKGGNRVTISS